jgi:hypothetical protein
MAALIHIGTRTYPLPAATDLQQLAGDIAGAMTDHRPLQVQVEVATEAMTVYVNTAVVDIIVLDWQGVGQGFTHG